MVVFGGFGVEIGLEVSVRASSFFSFRFLGHLSYRDCEVEKL